MENQSYIYLRGVSSMFLEYGRYSRRQEVSDEVKENYTDRLCAEAMYEPGCG